MGGKVASTAYFPLLSKICHPLSRCYLSQFMFLKFPPVSAKPSFKTKRTWRDDHLLFVQTSHFFIPIISGCHIKKENKIIFGFAYWSEREGIAFILSSFKEFGLLFLECEKEKGKKINGQPLNLSPLTYCQIDPP